MEWSDIEPVLLEGWREIADCGSLADAAIEQGMQTAQAIEALWPMQQIAAQGLEEWLQEGRWPQMPPGALRLAEFQLYFALGVCRELSGLPGSKPPSDWTREESIRWLLDIWPGAGLPAVDNTLGDLLGSGDEGPQAEV